MNVVSMSPQKFEVLNTLQTMIQDSCSVGVCEWLGKNVPNMADLVGIKLQCERMLGKNFSLAIRLSPDGKNINLYIEEK